MAPIARRKKKVRTPEESWAGIFDEWIESGLPVEDYCKREQFSIDGFLYFYERQFGRKPEPMTRVEPLFVQLSVVGEPRQMDRGVTYQEAHGESKIEIVIGGQPFAVRVQAGFDPATLRQVLVVLGGK